MAPSGTTPRIVALAAKISSSVAELQDSLSAQGVESPSFAEDSPQYLPPDVSHIRDDVLDATAELHELLLEPLMLLYKFAGVSNLISIDAICRFHILDAVPSGGQASFEDIAEKTGLDKTLVRRLLRHAISMRILREPEAGIVAHTKISKFLAIPYINSWVKFESNDTWPAIPKVAEAIEKWPSSEEANQTGFALVNDGKSVFDVLSTDPARAMRFAGGMKSLDHVPGCADAAVATAYDWSSLGNVLIVNVGGSRGQVAIDLASKFENVKLLVQDSAMVIEGAGSGVPSELKERVQFMKHELFEQQTVRADVYFFRMVIRNWGDKYAVGILKAQVPALRPGAKILIQDACMPEPDAIPLWRERVMRAVDLSVKCYFNSRERYLDEWKSLLAAADERFVLHQVFEPKDSLLSVLEVHWDVPSTVED
ncbi:putative sterigmatocystin 8-O-methyltransferase [Rosellinia necatrix]|uniref:Putative sterigmatocystin 8-O-methyltransferase n=1 Tax=Rosellinia necatrix TaxID=77044 RepID=A0A1W2TU12_ROSNE|nr:putative sterigmatocystin 8-O-methyltransferase [Rosellinia necatrix]